MAAINLTKLDNLSGVPLLTVLWCDDRDNIPPGFGPSDGQLLPRSVFPDAFTRISNSPKRVVSDAAWLADPLKRGKYTLGDGSTNFRVPDLNGKQTDSIGALYLRGDGKNAGTSPGDLQGDVIRNIADNFPSVGHNSWPTSQGPLNKFIKPDKPANVNGISAPVGTGQVYTELIYVVNASAVVPTGPENRPVSATGCFIIKLFGAVIGEAQANIAQMATDIAKLQSDVQLKLNKSNVVGLVADGAIIESGVNANGRYIKYADGTLECSIFKSFPMSSFVQGGAVFYVLNLNGVTSWNWPVPFVGNPADVIATFQLTSNNSYQLALGVENLNTTVYGSFHVRCIDGFPQTQITPVIRGRAIGRWKA